MQKKRIFLHFQWTSPVCLILEADQTPGSSVRYRKLITGCMLILTSTRPTATDMTSPGRWYRNRGVKCPNINFSAPCLSLKSFEQGSAHSGRRLYKHRQQQQIKSCRVRGLRVTVPPPQISAPSHVQVSHLLISFLYYTAIHYDTKRCLLISGSFFLRSRRCASTCFGQCFNARSYVKHVGLCLQHSTGCQLLYRISYMK